MEKTYCAAGGVWRWCKGMGRVWAVLLAMAGGAFGQVTNQIVAVTPAAAAQGTSGLTVTFALDTDAPPAPPAGILPNSVKLGTLVGTAITHDEQYTVTAAFTIPTNESLGARDTELVFNTPGGTLTFFKAGGFTVTSGAEALPCITLQPQSQTVQAGAAAAFSLAASGAVPLAFQWQKNATNLPAGTNTLFTVAAAAPGDAGDYRCIVTNRFGAATSTVATLSLASAPPYSGYNLFAPLTSTNTYLINNNGSTVHTWSSQYRPGNAVYLLEDGTLLRTANSGGTNFSAGGAGGRVEQFDWAGNLLWNYNYNSPAYRQHHDVRMLPSGNILMIAWEHKTAAEAVSAGRNPTLLTDGALWPDHLIEVQPTGTVGGVVVWEWHVWDHLVQDYDAAQDNFGVVADHPEWVDINQAQVGAGADWNHVNAVDYNPALDQIVLSVRQFSEVWVIDHGTTTEEAAGHTGGRHGRGGDLLYRWGNPQSYDAGAAADQQLFVQHNAQWIPAACQGAGHFLVFNNGQGRPSGNYSTVDEFVPPLAPDGSYSNTLPFGPATATWTYAASPASYFYAANISGAQRLPNGHTLICDGPTSRFFEVTSAGETIWEYDAGGSVFRVTRYGFDYAGFAGTGLNPGEHPGRSYAIVDTAQTTCYNTSNAVPAPQPGAAWSGQDAQYSGLTMSYTLATNGLIVQDNRTGLTWTQTPDLNTDGVINASDKLTYTGALAYAATLCARGFGGYSDWRLPSIKELYSLMNFTGLDVSGPDVSLLKPFIDTNYFAFGYGDTNAGDRLIDAQFASTTLYVDTVMTGSRAMFGLNLADGRIKGYPVSGKSYYVYFVRGNTNYGVNAFVENGDGTVFDLATGRQWQQADSGAGLNWQAALAYAESLNLAGYQDWRLPDAKELQSILDYTRAPGITASAAIDPRLHCTPITNEAGTTDYAWYWASTTHANTTTVPGKQAVYVCFGRALGYMNGSWQDVHGAGAQRSDSKGGSLSEWTYTPYGYYSSLAPQGDAVRIFNHVRCVRAGATAPTNDTDADGLSDWYEYDYVTNITAMAPAGDLDGDLFPNLAECGAGTSPIDAGSLLAIAGLAWTAASNAVVTWPGVPGKTYRVQRSTNLMADAFSTDLATAVDATPPLNTFTDRIAGAQAAFYRVTVAPEP